MTTPQIGAVGYFPPLNQIGSGRWFAPFSEQNSVTSAALGNGTLRLAPWLNPNAFAIQAIACGVSVVGDAGSVLRMGVYLDNGFGMPGALLYDFGTCPTDTVVVTPAALANLVIPGVPLHIGGAVQLVTVTQPTMFCNTQSDKPGIVLDLGGANPTAAASSSGYSMTGVVGALPAQFVNAGPVNAVPRLFMKRT